MPCRGPEDDWPGSGALLRDERQKVHELTRLLCHACRCMLSSHLVLTPELASWFREHDAADRQRIDDEEKRRKRAEAAQDRRRYLASVRERVVGQLSPDEKEALGL